MARGNGAPAPEGTPAYEAAEGEAPERKPKLDDGEFLAIARAERQNAIGINAGDEVVTDRIRALEYFKGEMLDVTSMPNRSKAVATEVSDAILTALPDLCEIFVGGEDIGAFRPVNEDDEDAAKQETAVVNHVIMEQNPGFELVHDGIHDALLAKVGVYNFWIEEEESYSVEKLEGQTVTAVQAATEGAKQPQADYEVMNVTETGADPLLGPLYSFQVQRRKTSRCVKIKAVDPSRFSVARDTANLRDAVSCHMMTTPRAQELKRIGFDPDLVDELPTFNAYAAQQVELARDTAGENLNPQAASAHSVNDLRTVCVYVSVVRVDAYDDGKPQIWRLVTNEAGTVLLDKEELQCIPFAAGSPYRIPHRFYGRSLADLLIEHQRLKTAFLRLHVDQSFFAVNSRHEISMQDANEHTIGDYLNNVPGFPVRSKTGNATKPLSNERSEMKLLDTLEYLATQAEQRTGVVRNAQGLNPDTLHDTATGAQQLMTAAQKRLRFVARCLAETLFKDLFIGVHTLLRTSGEQQMAVRLTGQWVPTDPSSWGERKDMIIDIGMGAGGREMDLQMSGAIGNLMNQIVTAQGQGAISPPVIQADNVYEYAEWFLDRAGVKKAQKFFTDPKPAMQQQAANPQPPPPDPKLLEVQAKAQLAQQEQAHQHEMAQAESARKDAVAAADVDRKQKEAALHLNIKRQEADEAAQLARDKAAREAQLANDRAAFEANLATDKQNKDYELALRQQDLDHEAQLRGIEKEREIGHAQNDAKTAVAMHATETEAQLPKNRPGGDLAE